jgi:RND family efflux transporter MFP subunit
MQWVGVLAAGMVFGGSLGCSAEASGPPARPAVAPVRVRMAPVERTVVSQPIRASGVSVAKDQATLGFKVGGLVSQVRVHAGDRVKAGELLASLDTAEIDAQVQQAQAAVEKAERDAARAQTLVTAKALPVERSEDAQTALRMAKEGRTIARFNRAHARLVASADGRVVRRLVEPGMVVAAGTPIVQLDRAGAGYVIRVGLVDRELLRVSLGDPAQVTLDALPGKTFSAKVSQLAVEPSPLSGIYDVELRLDAAPPHLVAGLVAKVTLTPKDGEPLALIPVEALVEGEGQRGQVFTVEGGRAKKVAVETAFLVGEELAVRHGLEGVGQVVKGGAAFLSDGAAVQEVAP